MMEPTLDFLKKDTQLYTIERYKYYLSNNYSKELAGFTRLKFYGIWSEMRTEVPIRVFVATSVE